MSNARILIADDDRLVLATLAKGLREAGYTVIEAGSGEEAIRLCEEHQPELAILDIRMQPGIDGIEVARCLQERTATPFLILSAYGDGELVEQATDHGALGYLIKPIDVERIIPTIEAALKRASQISKLEKSESNLVDALKDDQLASTAVGVIMERHLLSREAAFEKLRKHARSRRCNLTTVANELINATEAANIS